MCSNVLFTPTVPPPIALQAPHPVHLMMFLLSLVRWFAPRLIFRAGGPPHHDDDDCRQEADLFLDAPRALCCGQLKMEYSHKHFSRPDVNILSSQVPLLFVGLHYE